MPQPERTIRFQLAEGRTIDAHLVRTDDGRLVARLSHEVADLPRALGVDLEHFRIAEGEEE